MEEHAVIAAAMENQKPMVMNGVKSLGFTFYLLGVFPAGSL